MIHLYRGNIDLAWLADKAPLNRASRQSPIKQQSCVMIHFYTGNIDLAWPADKAPLKIG